MGRGKRSEHMFFLDAWILLHIAMNPGKSLLDFRKKYPLMYKQSSTHAAYKRLWVAKLITLTGHDYTGNGPDARQYEVTELGRQKALERFEREEGLSNALDRLTRGGRRSLGVKTPTPPGWITWDYPYDYTSKYDRKGATGTSAVEAA